MKSVIILPGTNLDTVAIDGSGFDLYNGEYLVSIETRNVKNEKLDEYFQSVPQGEDAPWSIADEAGLYKITDEGKRAINSALAEKDVTSVIFAVSNYVPPRDEIPSDIFPENQVTADALRQEFGRVSKQDKYVEELLRDHVSDAGASLEEKLEIEALREDVEALEAKANIVGRRVYHDATLDNITLTGGSWRKVTNAAGDLTFRPEADDIELDIEHNNEIFTHRFRRRALPTIADPQNDPINSSKKEALEFQANNEFYCALDSNGVFYIAVKNDVRDLELQVYEIVYGEKPGIEQEIDELRTDIDGNVDAIAALRTKIGEVETEAGDNTTAIAAIRADIARLEKAIGGSVEALFNTSDKAERAETTDKILAQSVGTRTVVTDEHEITDPDIASFGDALGELATANIPVDGTPESLAYAVTEKVDKIALGGDSIPHEIGGLSKARILQLNDIVHGKINGALIVRAATQTAPGYITLLTQYNVQPITLTMRDAQGRITASITRNWVADEGSLNGESVGGYTWNQSTLDPNDLLALFFDGATPRAVKDILLHLRPTPTSRGPHISITLATVDEQPAGIKVIDVGEIVHDSVEASKASLAPINERLDDLSRGEGHFELRSINSQATTLKTIFDMLGVTRTAFDAAASTTRYNLRLNIYTPKVLADQLNASGKPLTLSVEGQPSNPLTHTWVEGTNIVVFDWTQKSTVSGIINNSLDSNYVGSVELSISDDTTRYLLENIIFTGDVADFAFEGSTAKIPAAQLPDISSGGAPAWNRTTRFDKDDVVVHNGRLFISNSTGNVNFEPETDRGGLVWIALGITTWFSTQIYYRGQITNHQNKLFLCLAKSGGTVPGTDATRWKQLTFDKNRWHNKAVATANVNSGNGITAGAVNTTLNSVAFKNLVVGKTYRIQMEIDATARSNGRGNYRIEIRQGGTGSGGTLIGFRQRDTIPNGMTSQDFGSYVFTATDTTLRFNTFEISRVRQMFFNTTLIELNNYEEAEVF